MSKAKTVGEMTVEEIEKLLWERPEFLTLFNIVKDDARLIDVTLTMMKQITNKKDIPLEDIFFMPEDVKKIFASKAIDGIVKYNTYMRTLRGISQFRA